MNARCELCGVVAVVEDGGMDDCLVDFVCEGCGTTHYVTKWDRRPPLTRALPRPSRPSPPPLRRYQVKAERPDPERLADLRAIARRREAVQRLRIEVATVPEASDGSRFVHRTGASQTPMFTTQVPQGRRKLAPLFAGALIVAAASGVTVWRLDKLQSPANPSSPPSHAAVTAPLALVREAPRPVIAAPPPPSAAVRAKAPQKLAPPKTLRSPAPSAVAPVPASAPVDPVPQASAAAPPSVAPAPPLPPLPQAPAAD